MFRCMTVCASCTLMFVSFRVSTVAPRSLIWLPNVATLVDKSSKRFGKLAILGAAWKYSCTLCKSCWMCASCRRVSIQAWAWEHYSHVIFARASIYLFTCTVKLLICCLRSDSLEKMIVWLFCRSRDSEWHFCRASGTPSLPAITVTRTQKGDYACGVAAPSENNSGRFLCDIMSQRNSLWKVLIIISDWRKFF